MTDTSERKRVIFVKRNYTFIQVANMGKLKVGDTFKLMESSGHFVESNNENEFIVKKDPIIPGK